MTLLPGLRLDWQRAAFDGATGDAGGAQRPDGRVLRLVAAPPGARLRRVPVAAAHLRRADGRARAGRGRRRASRSPPSSTPRTTRYAEVGLAAAAAAPQLRVTATAWVRLSRHTLDDTEVGDTALTADYNYGAGGPPASRWAPSGRSAPPARVRQRDVQLSQGTGIASARYLFTPAQLAYTGYQATDNAQRVTANGGFDLADLAGSTHLYGAGHLRQRPAHGTDQQRRRCRPAAIVDVTLRHRFDIPLRPEVAIDVRNLFDVVYAYRIATGSLSGSAYGSLRDVDVRLIMPFGS